MGKNSKEAAPKAVPKVSEKFAKEWSVFGDGNGGYNIQAIYTFCHMWYGRLDIQQKCKELLLNNKKANEKELIDKLGQILAENSSPGKGNEREFADHVKKTNWVMILAKMKEMIKQGG